MKRILTILSPCVVMAGTTLLLGCGTADQTTMTSQRVATHAENAGTTTQERGVGSEVGSAGSLARFAVANDTLYALTSGRIVAFDISDEEQIQKVGSVRVASDIETLFSDGKSLFVGAQTALNIFSLEEPHSPKSLGIHPHVRACDPVVTSGDYAFVTLNSGGGACRGGENVLKVVDFSDPAMPREVKKIRMNQPFGLGVAGDRLFVCDGESELVEFDISDPTETYELSRAQDEACSDVVPLNDLLITTGPRGISQFDLSNDGFYQLSRIHAEKVETELASSN